VTEAFPAPVVEWSERYAVGIRVIDGQHRQMLDLVNRVLGSLGPGRELYEALDALRDLLRATEHHFVTEERLMDESGMAAERHRAEHRRLIESLRSFTDRLNAETVGECSAFLRDWLLHHIEEVDRPFAASLRAHGTT
jgi:hemerythrin-like metal-binding protein